MFTGTVRSSHPYVAALVRLAEAHHEAEQLATMLEYFASVLRGAWPDPDGPPLEMFPSLYHFRRVLEGQAEAHERAEAEWDRLSSDEREGLVRPGELE
jgi:hypothetical protein